MKYKKTIILLTVLLAIFLAVVSSCGAFMSKTYARDSASMAAQGVGQDLVDLFFVVPLLLVSLIFVRRNDRTAYYLFGGTVFYIMYSFIIYGFGVHFNFLFLLYCFILGLSLYLFILVVLELSGMDVESWYGPKTPIRFCSIYLILVALMFYALWLKDIVPSLFGNNVSTALAESDLLVNPVHVIDIAFALPGLILAAVFLLRKHRLGYVLAPIALVFIIILAVALTGMVIMLKVRGISEDMSVAGIFVVLAVFSSVLLVLFLKNITFKDAIKKASSQD